VHGGRTVAGELARRGELVDLDALTRSVVCRYADARVPVTVAVPAAGAGELAAPRADRVAAPATGESGATGTTGVAGATGTECDAVLVNGLPEGLERLLVNLLDNATRYAKSAVTVAVRRDGAWAELSVTDDGPGIPAADRERAFGRFTRLDDARSRDGDEAGGAGLGLAIVRATAQAHGGAASLESAGPADTPSGDTSGSASGLRAVVRLPLGS
jgi:signal transduction histidine kinase